MDDGQRRQRTVEALESFGRALSENDRAGIASAFDFPAFFIGHQGAFVLHSEEELHTMSAEGRKFYDDEGILATRPEVQSYGPLTDRLSEATVRWPGFDAAGNEVWTETSRYVFLTGEDGRPKIRVAVTLGGETVAQSGRHPEPR
ncbi:MAG: hypothetical protein JST30_02705 [Armatimonadetes bacterium]|nr:hypothetical protein [Armatimonadota bacterium]